MSSSISMFCMRNDSTPSATRVASYGLFDILLFSRVQIMQIMLLVREFRRCWQCSFARLRVDESKTRCSNTFVSFKNASKSWCGNQGKILSTSPCWIRELVWGGFEGEHRSVKSDVYSWHQSDIGKIFRVCERIFLESTESALVCASGALLSEIVRAASASNVIGPSAKAAEIFMSSIFCSNISSSLPIQWTTVLIGTELPFF